jgi:benzoyl-CoA reductase/2-hydroxyglutaryl-CoA dehydratase subunit BcrC/BadD/HgdB
MPEEKPLNDNILLSSLKSRLDGEPQRIAEAKKSGQKVVGYFCPYGTEELILAADMLPVRLAFGGEPEAVSAGEEFLKPNSCPYASACLGYKIISSNPYYASVDAVCVAYTYSSMRRVQEYWQPYFQQPAFPLGLPQTHDRFRTKPQAIEYFKKELELLRKRLGEFRGRRIKDKEIRDAISLCSKIREKLLVLYKYPMDGNSPVEWRQVLQITQAGVLMDRANFLKELEKITNDLRLIKQEDMRVDKRPRLMIAGSLIGIGDDKVLDIIERAGGNIVVDSVCTGSMFFRKKVPAYRGYLEQPIEALAKRYLYNVPCPFMTDITRRLNRIVNIAKDYRVHGLIYYNLNYNETWRAEFKSVKDTLYRELTIPTLLIETDYSQSDTAELSSKVEAFLKMIGG